MKIYAHRGSSGKNPEMTRQAYLAAIEDGADGFECDVRLSKDGEIVCIHDATTNRISGKKLRVSKTSLRELQGAYEVIVLKELLDLAIEARKDLLIETKHPTVFAGRVERKVVELLDTNSERISSCGIEVVVMSFSKFALGRVKSKWKVCKISKYYLPAIFSNRKIAALSIELISRRPSLVAKLAKKGSRVLIWTVNKKNDFELCKDLKVYGVITNYPSDARNYG
jgi:glycerophosphoryl diester phosphodiesterase